MPPGTEKSEADSRPMQLVRSMIRSLENGEIQPGSKLPSIRQSIRLSGFSQGTVVEAYRILLDMGRIQSVPGGGYYATGQSTDESPRPEQIRLLQRLSLDPALDRTLSLGNKTMVASFGLAVPSEDMLPVSALKRCLMEAYRLENVHTYSFPPGLEELRKQISLRYRQAGVDISWQELILTGSATEAAYLVLREMLREGDLVALESPCYSGFLHQVKKFKLKLLEVPVDPGLGLDIDALESRLRKGARPRLLITVPNFHNPTGALMDNERRIRLLDLAMRYDFYILEDDVYGGIHHGVRRCPPLISLGRERIFLVSSFAKSIVPSMRLGWLIGPSDFHNSMLERFRTLSLGNSRLTEQALALFLSKRQFDRHLRRLRKESRIRMAEFRKRILQWPLDLRVSSPEGGFWLWLELPAKIDTLKLQKRALEKGITVSPGPIFSPSGGYRNYLRINCALPPTESMLKHLDVLGKIASDMA
ncbi:MAG: hypothetical protein CMN77_20460 [Spirochaetaceae bacterium]|nr:hypothetical protein [Spirochaetaceae bacterium]